MIETQHTREFKLGAFPKTTLTYTVFQSEARTSKDLLFCLPGGGMSADYFNLGNYDEQSYSFVQHMNARGYDCLTMDNPGTGQNTLPDTHAYMSPRDCADYCALALESYDLGPYNRTIGVAHSMGGMILSLLQARHDLLSAIFLMGSNAEGLDWGLSDTEKQYIDQPTRLRKNLEHLTREKFGNLYIKQGDGPRHGSKVFAGATPELTQRLGDVSALLFGAGGLMSMIKGSFRPEVEALTIPIFMTNGEHDIGAPPDIAKAAYIHAASIKTQIYPQAGHNSLAFPCISDMCADLDDWIRCLSI